MRPGVLIARVHRRQCHIYRQRLSSEYNGSCLDVRDSCLRLWFIKPHVLTLPLDPDLVYCATIVLGRYSSHSGKIHYIQDADLSLYMWHHLL